VKTTVNRLEDHKVELTVELPAEDVARAIEAEWHELASTAKIAGFRKGKVPRPILEQRVGADAVLRSAVEKIVPEAYPRAIDEERLAPIDLPKIEVDEYSGEGPLTFRATLEVEPEASLEGYEGIPITVPPETASEADIQAQLDALRERFAKLDPAEGRPVRAGDFALIDFTGYLDDVAFDGGEGTDFLLEIGSGRFLPGFEDGVIGAAKGEQRDIHVDVPEDYHGTEIAGKRVRFDVTVKEIKEKKLPDVTDEFASEASEHETLLELRSEIRDRLETELKGRAIMRGQSQVLDWLQEHVEVEVPPQMIEAKRDDLVRDFLRMIQSQNIAIEDYFRLTEQTPDELTANMEREAGKRVREELALDAAARAEHIEIYDGELDEEIVGMAQRLEEDPGTVRARLEERGSVGELRRAMARRKTLDWLTDHAKKTVKEDEPKTEDTGTAGDADETAADQA
jgi:trigger factor